MANLILRKLGPMQNGAAEVWFNPGAAGDIVRDEFFGVPPAPIGAGLIKVWTGAAWVEKPVKYWTGSAWVTKPVKFWTGAAFVST